MVKEMSVQAMSVEVLDPEEEAALQYIKEKWDKSKVKTNMTQLSEDFLKEKFGFTSIEKARQLVLSLFRKGQILIDVKGRERLCRPNHVIINSKTRPTDFRNITIVDERTDFPISRVWLSMYANEGKPFLNITESKRAENWETANNIIIPPEAMEEFFEMTKYMEVQLKKLEKR